MLWKVLWSCCNLKTSRRTQGKESEDGRNGRSPSEEGHPSFKQVRLLFVIWIYLWKWMRSRSACCERWAGCACLAVGSKSSSSEPVGCGGLRQVSHLRAGRDSFSPLQLISWELEIRATAAAAMAQHVNLGDRCFNFMLICWAVLCRECVLLPVLQLLLRHKEQITGWDKQVAAATSLSCCWVWWCLEVSGLRSFTGFFYCFLKVLIVSCNLALHLFRCLFYLTVEALRVLKHMSSRVKI